jgi:hypothetical protein
MPSVALGLSVMLTPGRHRRMLEMLIDDRVLEKIVLYMSALLLVSAAGICIRGITHPWGDDYQRL